MKKKALAIKMGADHVVNYHHTSTPEMVQQFTNGEGYDVVFDTVGDGCLDQAFQAARIGGDVVTILARRAHDLYPMFGKGLTLSTVMQPLPLLTGIGCQYYGQILASESNSKRFHLVYTSLIENYPRQFIVQVPIK